MANVGGMLLPLGDPPLLVGYIMGVPFFWTLRLFPIWLLYVGSLASAFYLLISAPTARESRRARADDLSQLEPLSLLGPAQFAVSAGDRARGAAARGPA